MKKTVYIILTSLLGLILSFIIHAFWEIILTNAALEKGIALQSSGRCFLPDSVRITLPILGIIGGILLGFRWWRIVYIEKRHWSFPKK